MRSMATEEFNALNKEADQLVNATLPSLLLPPSSTAKMSALVELKAGVGGVESCLFLLDMLRMYQRYIAETSNWKITMVSVNIVEAGGARDALMEVEGEGAYDRLRWESGVHRVQRVPSTDASGRVHTSTVAVIVSLVYPAPQLVGITSLSRSFPLLTKRLPRLNRFTKWKI